MPPKRKGEVASSFETVFSELQKVVDELEAGGLDLERALALFDRGNALAQSCDQFLSSAELRVTRLPAESASPLPEV